MDPATVFVPFCRNMIGDLLEFLRASEYQNGAGGITVASPVSGELGADSVNSSLEHCEKERYSEKRFCSLLSTFGTEARAFKVLLYFDSRAPNGLCSSLV